MSKEKPCRVCLKTFPRNCDLTAHVLHVHCSDRRYLCKICGSRFNVSSHLQRHLNVHAGKNYTLYCYNNEPSKNKYFLIWFFSLARNSQEPKLKRSFEILWVLFEKISVTLTDLNHGFGWPWGKLGIFFVNNASKEVFWPKNFLTSMQQFKSAILLELKNCQNGSFELVHGIQKIF